MKMNIKTKSLISKAGYLGVQGRQKFGKALTKLIRHEKPIMSVTGITGTQQPQCEWQWQEVSIKMSEKNNRL